MALLPAWLMALVVSAYAAAQDVRGAGSPVVVNHAPDAYDASEQNWGIAQDAQGLMYFGNNRGVLIFDGVHWDLVRTANRCVVRGLVAADDGRVYLGGTNEFGYVAGDARGVPRYVSLSAGLAAEDARFGNVGHVLVAGADRYFLAGQGLFHCRDDRVTAVPETARGTPAVRGGRAYVYLPGKGVAVMDGAVPRLLPDTRVAPEAEPLHLLAGADGGLTGVDALGRFSILLRGRADVHAPAAFAGRQGATAAHAVPVTPYLAENKLYHATVRADGRLVFATLHGGMVETDPAGTLVGRYDQAAGLRRNRVHRVFEDREHNLWAALNNGLAMVEATPFTRYAASSGLDETLLCHTAHRGSVFTGTYSGLYVLTANGYRLLERATHGVWDLHVFQDRLLALGDTLAEVTPQGTRTLPVDLAATDTTFYCMGTSPRFPHHLFLGSRRGLWALETAPVCPGEPLRPLRLIPVGPVPHRVRAVAAANNGDLWVGSTYEGASYVAFGGEDPSLATVYRYDTSHGLPDLKANRPHRVGDEVVMETADGPYAVRGEAPENMRFEPHPVFHPPDRAVRRLTPDGTGRIWALSDEGIGAFEPTAEGGYRWQPGPLQHVSGKDLYVADGALWVETTDGLYRLDSPMAASMPRTPPVVRLRRVAVQDRWVLFGGHPSAGAAGPAAPSMVPEEALADGGGPAFDYAAPSFRRTAGLRYQSRLAGYETRWSPWSSRTRTAYTNLPGGDYTFMVRARNAFGEVGPPTRFAFSVPHPWYRRPGWLAVWLVAVPAAVGLALAGFAAWLGRRHRREQARERVLQETRKFEALGRLAGGIAHDFRGVLSTIMGFSSLIRAEVGEHPALAESLREIERASRSGNGLVNQILTFARRRTVALRPLDARAETEAALSLARVAVPPGVTVQRALAEDAGHVLGDTTQWHQLVLNLFTNAVQALQGGEGTVTVGLTGLHEAAGARVRLWVRDTGTGMDDATRARLFEPFFTTRDGEGTGLGLAVVHGIVQAMGGTITVHSEPGRGSLFALTFQAVAAPEPAPASAPVENHAPRGPRLLWIDTCPDRLQRAVLDLRAHGFHATGALADEVPAAGWAGEAAGCDLVVLGGPAAAAAHLRAGLGEALPALPVWYCRTHAASGREADPAPFDGVVDAHPPERLAGRLRRAVAPRAPLRRSG